MFRCCHALPTSPCPRHYSRSPRLSACGETPPPPPPGPTTRCSLLRTTTHTYIQQTLFNHHAHARRRGGQAGRMSYTSSPPLIRVYDSGSRQYGHRSSALPRHAAPSSPSLSSSSSHHSSSISSASGSTSAATAAAPMPIPHARGTSPPPPLPPPRYITGLDTGLHHHNHHGHMLSWQMVGSPRAEPPGHAAAFGPHHRSGLSLLGGGGGGGGGGGSSGGGRSRRPEGSHTQYTRRPSEETDAEVRGTGATGRRHSSSAATTTSSSTHTVDADLHTDADMSGDDENASTSRRPSAANRR